MSAIRTPTNAASEGLAHIDWQIQMTSASRHRGTKERKQSATVLLQARKTPDLRDKIMFEVTKEDVKLMLDKLSILDQIAGSVEDKD